MTEVVNETVAVADQTQELLADVLNSNSSVDRNDINKAAAIRRALQVLSGDAKPMEVVEYLKREHNIDVSAVYVSAIKAQTARKVGLVGFESLRLAKKLVKEAGSVSAARAVLDVIQQEQESLAETRNRYQTQLKDIEDRLTDTARPLTNNEKRELLADKRKVAKLLESLEDL